MEDYKLKLVNEFRKGNTLERDLIEGLNDEKAYNLILFVKSIEKIVF
jgi:hypothetical protein